MPFSLSNKSEEHTSELQSHDNLVCRLLLEKKKMKSARDAMELRRRAGTMRGSASAALSRRVALLLLLSSSLLVFLLCFSFFFFFLNERPPPGFPPFPYRAAFSL